MNILKQNIAGGAVMAVIFLCLPLMEAKAAPHQIAGPAVDDGEEIREQLVRMGYYEEDVSGYFNFVTNNAVTRFQKDYGLPPTGFVGPSTKMKLENVEMMAKIVHGEARGESFIGKVGVAAVVLNRIASPDFPDSTEEVIFQRNAFTAVNDDQYLLIPDKSAYDAVREAMDGVDPTKGAVFYYNPSGVSDEWIFSRTVLTQIGRHFFAE
ncbi:cell wall hydrolase [Planococcus sp. CAU13]|uniref:cell wall hydrolase n=1 Tax=Planococcus sp. CAU13 TaxID=1541197 RepID=UPI00052FEBDA|nr:cell wall hydrolase [Planococcus sp. CAU13]